MATSREFLWLVKESALNTVMSSPVAGTDSIYIRLTEGNSFSAWTKPIIERVPYGGGFATIADVVTDHYEVKGSLKTKLYPLQAKFLCDWMCTRVNTGQTLPWVTTEPPGDLASVSAYHAVQRADGTFKRQRFSGCKVMSGTIQVSRDSTIASLNLEIMGCRAFGNAIDGTVDPTSGEFADPVDANYPTGPFTFKMTAGNVTIGSVLVGYENLNISFTNAVDGRWFEAGYLQVLQFCGRSSKLDASIRFKATPDYQTALEVLTAQNCSVGFISGITGGNLTIDFKGKNYITDLPYDTPLDKVFMRGLTLENTYDLAAATDLTITVV